MDIDTAQVSVLEREILSERGFKHSPLPTRLSLHYLKTRNRVYNRVFRKTVVEWGAAAQQLGAGLLARAPEPLAAKKWRLVAMLRSPMMEPSKTTLRDALPRYGLNEALLLQPPEPAARTVFYFPGCGSERLYSEVAMAAVYVLLATGVRVVLPPPHLCCGFPARANAKRTMHDDVTLRDTIVLSQIREMLGYLKFDAVAVSCGTCREALHQLGVEDIFGAMIADVSSFVLEHAPERFRRDQARRFLYHAPCHDSLQGEGAQLVRRLGGEAVSVPGCCSEAGTLSLSRPDITNAMLARKRDALAEVTGGDLSDRVIVTNCPSCLSGLGRNRTLGVRPAHLAVLLAEYLGGGDWQREMVRLAARAEVVAF